MSETTTHGHAAAGRRSAGRATVLIGVIVSLHRFLTGRYGENLRTVTITPISIAHAEGIR